MLSLLLKIFDVFREKSKTSNALRRDCLEALVAFCSQSKAAVSEFYLARDRDGDGPRSNATMSAFISLEKLDGVAQQLQFRARAAFAHSEVPLLLFELLRRTSQAKQFLIIAEHPYLREGFLADQQWVEYQVRRTVTAAARHAGFDLADPTLPFLIGFHAASDLPEDNSDASTTSPSVAIMSGHDPRTVKAEWEAAGHKWDWKQVKASYEGMGIKWRSEWETDQPER